MRSVVSVAPAAPSPRAGLRLPSIADAARMRTTPEARARRRWNALRAANTAFHMEQITVFNYVWFSATETVLMAVASCVMLVPMAFVARWLGESLESQSVAAGETTQTLNPLFWADDVGYSHSALVAFAFLPNAVIGSLLLLPAVYMALRSLYGRKASRNAFFVVIPFMLLYGIGVYQSILNRAKAGRNAWVWRLVPYGSIIVGWPLMGFLVGKETGESALGRKFFVTVTFAAVCSYTYVNVLAPAYFSGSYVTQMVIRVVVHPIIRIVALHLVGSMVALSLKEANPKALHLLPGIIQIILTLAGRFLQASNSDVLLTIAMEVVLVFFEYMEARDILEGRTTVEWLLHKVFGGKNVATIDARSGDQVGDDRMHPRREQMFGDILTVLAMSEGASSISCVAFLLVVPTNPGVAGGPPLGWQTVVANGLIMTFFEIFVSDFFVARVAHRKHATHPERCLSVATVYANRSSSSYAVVYWVYILTASYYGLAIFSAMCVDNSGGDDDALLSLCGTVNSTLLPIQE